MKVLITGGTGDAVKAVVERLADLIGNQSQWTDGAFTNW